MDSCLHDQSKWQPNCQTKILSRQIVILARHFPLTGCYFEPCIHTTHIPFTESDHAKFCCIVCFTTGCKKYLKSRSWSNGTSSFFKRWFLQENLVLVYRSTLNFIIRMALSQKVWKLLNSWIWLAETDIDCSLDFSIYTSIKRGFILW